MGWAAMGSGHYTLRSSDQLCELLDAHGLSTRAFARRVSDHSFSVSHQRIGQLRVGVFPRVAPELARRIARALGVRVSVLFDGPKVPAP